MSVTERASTPRPEHPNRRRYLIAAAIAVVVAAVAVTLTVVFADRGGTDPNAAATRTAVTWGKAMLRRDRPTVVALTCPGQKPLIDNVYSAEMQGTGIHTSDVTRRSSTSWALKVTTTGTGGGYQIPVTVEKRTGKYTVCVPPN